MLLRSVEKELSNLLSSAKDKRAQSDGGIKGGINKRKKLYGKYQKIARELCKQDPKLIQDHQLLLKKTIETEPNLPYDKITKGFKNAIQDVINEIKETE